MKEDYLITIQGTMEQNGGSDSVQLMTRGSFVKRGGRPPVMTAASPR